MTKLQPYHHAWLGVHPERDETWLRARLKDGFDVHHLDGDHGNNDPLNLVLMDGADHMMLHNGGTRVTRIFGFVCRRGEQAKATKRDNSSVVIDIRAFKLAAKVRRKEELAAMASARRRKTRNG